LSQAATLSPTAARSDDVRLIGLISLAHFVSHYYILLLPPLFIFVRDEFGVSYTELGLALTVFNVVTVALQTAAGFLVDRIGARLILIGGLVLSGLSAAAAGLAPSFWLLVVAFGLSGLANTVYHPCNYAILSKRVSPERVSHAFSIHTFAGFLGTAATPATLLILQALFGWRAAFIASAIPGLIVAAILATQRATLFEIRAEKSDKPAAGQEWSGWRLLLSLPILRNLVFFALIAVIGSGISNYTLVALHALYGTPLSLANAALTGFLLLSAGGVLIGGFVAARVHRHGLVAAAGLVVSGLLTACVALYDLGTAFIVAVMSLSGFFHGLIQPARDMLVREVTPPGSFGKVFGFVTTGFNIGGIVAPLIYGALMDHGSPGGVFLLAAACSLIAVATVNPFKRRSAAV
jgi:MFS family permease